MYFDILVIGAGPAGLAFSSLASDMGLTVGLFDRQTKTALSKPENDGRDIAVSEASRKILADLGAWTMIDEADISPIRAAKVVDGDAPFALDFNPSSAGADKLGNIISNHIIRRVLYTVAAKKDNITWFTGIEVEALRRDTNAAIITLADGQTFTSQLAIAADTRFSQIRRDAGIKADMHDFGQTMIVGRMHGTTPHNHIAHECFRYDGGLAILPLNNDIASVVQTFSAEEAARFMAMNDQDYAHATEPRLKGLMGKLTPTSKRASYPLVGVYAQQFYAKRLALVGDAAVGMHPVTAHGFNFGIQGIANLIRHLRKANARGLDLGNVGALKAYNTDHRRLTWPLYQMTEKMMGLYTTNTIPARLVRKAALVAAQTAIPVKDVLMAKLTDVPVKKMIASKVAGKLPIPPKLPGL
ncbi:MAG: 5-demethoxyubiquinol-8 5-hydroxylase UbiM [Robiginitomaculum sp.]|nr:5-demethoxyubiquinol-8 5-hydroxylase UbiM [Robiginitomaculum sp.]